MRTYHYRIIYWRSFISFLLFLCCSFNGVAQHYVYLRKDIHFAEHQFFAGEVLELVDTLDPSYTNKKSTFIRCFRIDGDNEKYCGRKYYFKEYFTSWNGVTRKILDSVEIDKNGAEISIDNKCDSVLRVIGNDQLLYQIAGKSKISFSYQGKFRLSIKNIPSLVLCTDEIDDSMIPKEDKELKERLYNDILSTNFVNYHSRKYCQSNWGYYWIIVFAFGLCLMIILLKYMKARIGQVRDAAIGIEKFTDKIKIIRDCKVEEHDSVCWTGGQIGVRVDNFVYFSTIHSCWHLSYKAETTIKVKGLDNTPFKAQIEDMNDHMTFELGKPFENKKVKICNGAIELRTVCVNFMQASPTAIIDFANRFIFELEVDFNVTGKHPLQKKVPPRTQSYKFEIVEDGRLVWIGIDPGTTGSSIAYGYNPFEDIRISKVVDPINNNEYSVIDSKLLFRNREVVAQDKNEKYCLDIQSFEPGNHYEYGLGANDMTGRYTTFVSVKKLLGYKDKLKVRFQNENGSEVCRLFEGKELSGLLIKGLYRDLQECIGRQDPSTNKSLFFKEKFSPEKAVVAVPNNFTMKKIQDMIDAVWALGQFKEVLYAYEAEAVLYHYLRLAHPKEIDGKKIAVFDMGGATINASLFSVSIKYGKKEGFVESYNIDTLGRIGYGIGGDTIDFCLINAILSMPEVQRAWQIQGVDDKETNSKLVKFREKYAASLLKIAFILKCKIVENYQLKKDSLIEPLELSDILNDALNKRPVEITGESGGYVSLFKKKALEDTYGILTFEDFKNYIYGNIEDAIHELCGFAEVQRIRKDCEVELIFSGRSTLFPLIRECVIAAYNTAGFRVKTLDILNGSMDDLKTVVADGCCWYGLNHNIMKLTNNKCFYSYGFQMSKNASEIGFTTLLAVGTNFNSTYSSSKLSNIDWDFRFDGNTVFFYQVVGNNPEAILRDKKRHKYIPITQISVSSMVEWIEMKIDTNDIVCCTIHYNNGSEVERQGHVEAKDIVDDNDEHYLFAIRLDHNMDK